MELYTRILLPKARFSFSYEDHEHGYAEFQLLHQLSVLQITGAAFVAILLAAFYSFIRNLSFAPVYPDYIVPFRGRRTLRAPPIF